MSNEAPADVPILSLSDNAVTLQLRTGDEEPTVVKLSESDLETADAPTDERQALQAFVGQVISDRYAIHELIGAGGFGAVYRGEQVHLRKRCAIKILLPAAAKKQELVLRFEREAVAGAHVEHPNVVGASDFGKLPDGSCFLVLDYVEGTSLDDLMQAGPIPAERALGFARQIASALGAVHEKGIVHRDIKPKNILVDANGQVKLLDFGLAKVKPELLSSESRNATAIPALTGAGTIMGTLAYMAPESVKGMDAVDARSDLYALGIVMHEMLSGTRPFDEKEPAALFKRLRTGHVPTIRERAPDVNVPAPVEALVMKLVEREPAARFASANDLIAAIDAITEAPKETPAPAEDKPSEKASNEEPKPEAKPENAPAPANAAAPTKKPLDKRIVMAAAGALALVVIIVLVVALGGSDEKKKPAPVAPPPPPPTAVTPPPVQRPSEIDGVDAAGWRERMRKASLKKDWVQASKALLALAKIDPELVTGSELRGDVVAVIAGIGFDPSLAESDQVFDAMTNDLGPGGLDVLFQVMRTRGGSKAANRANDILSRADVMSRASPALRIAFDLRKASCPDKRNFFTRAVDEGDGRALDELIIAQKARCSNKKDPCCYREDPEMKDTIAKLRARIQQ